MWRTGTNSIGRFAAGERVYLAVALFDGSSAKLSDLKGPDVLMVNVKNVHPERQSMNALIEAAVVAGFPVTESVSRG